MLKKPQFALQLQSIIHSDASPWTPVDRDVYGVLRQRGRPSRSASGAGPGPPPRRAAQPGDGGGPQQHRRGWLGYRLRRQGAVRLGVGPDDLADAVDAGGNGTTVEFKPGRRTPSGGR